MRLGRGRQGPPRAPPKADWTPAPASTPTRRHPGPPRPRPAALSPPRPPAARFYGNGRAPGPGRGEKGIRRNLSGPTHRHGGPLPCPADVPAGCGRTAPGSRERLARDSNRSLALSRLRLLRRENSMRRRALSSSRPTPGLELAGSLELRLRRSFSRPSPRTPGPRLRLRGAAFSLSYLPDSHRDWVTWLTRAGKRGRSYLRSRGICNT